MYIQVGTEVKSYKTFRNPTNQNQNYGYNFYNENQRQQTSSNYDQEIGNMIRQGESSSSNS